MFKFFTQGASSYGFLLILVLKWLNFNMGVSSAKIMVLLWLNFTLGDIFFPVYGFGMVDFYHEVFLLHCLWS